MEQKIGIARWSVTGSKAALEDVAVDFIDGVDISLNALNARRANVRVREAEIVISYAAREDEVWIAESFSRRHPDVSVSLSWSTDQQGKPMTFTSLKDGKTTSGS